MVRHALAMTVLLALACVPGPLDETGKQCSTERPCGSGFVCVDSQCQDVAFDAGQPRVDAGVDAGVRDAGSDAGADAGRDGGFDGSVPDASVADAGFDAGAFPCDVNLILNPSFELQTATGGVRNWRALTGTITHGVPARSDPAAGRLWVGGNGNPAMQSDVASGPTSFGVVFCARAYARHEHDAGLTVSLIIRERAPDGGFIDSSNGSGTAITKGSWQPMTETYRTAGEGTGVDVRFSTSRFEPDASVLIDDVLLFRSCSTQCIYPP
ncbi:MAG: hypothetical protein GQE15_35840 [Archangiaceae bacterium]|nr:hypothetical protein [Archangiaceae bacterium]